eukprot:XP_786961.2 PREDICTED: tRNA-splicing endonuclease subunit Sen34 [Strongylocentrotus purpuratus]
MASKKLINLHFIAGQLCVWHADEVEILRSEHHIVGSLIGALPGAPRQNTQLGLPLQLMPEEAAVLLQHGVARLVTMSVAKPSKLQVKEFNQQRMESMKEQKHLWQEQVVEQRENLKEVIEEGRRKKKERKKQLRQKLSSTKGKDERDVPSIKEDNDSEEREKRTQESMCPGEMSIESRIEEGKNHTMGGEEDIDGRLCASDVQGIEGESILKGKEGMSKNVGSGNQPDGHDRRRMEDEEAKGNETLEGQDTETIRKACGAVRLHEDESNVPRTKSSLNHDDGIGVTEECTNAELKRKKSPTECESEAVLASPHVGNECFADEENDEDGKRRSIEEEEDTVKEDGCSVQLCTAEPVDSKFILEAPPSAWRYPSTEREKLKCRVFQHFWEMGYYMTSGTKFGGDFLVYPGDPFLFHSYFIVVCIPHHKQLSPLELVSHGRLGTFVKKAVVLCSVNSQKEVICTSIQWAGIS